MQIITRKTKHAARNQVPLQVRKKGGGGGVGINTTKGTMQRTFESYEALRKWMDLPTTRKAYNIVYVVWLSNTVRLEGRAMN